MILTLFTNDRLLRRELPERIKGQFWFGDSSDKQRKKLLELDASDGRWIAYSGKAARLLDESGNPLRCAPIAPMSLVFLKSELFGEKPMMLFTEPTLSARDARRYVKTEGAADITIGSLPMNDLVYSAPKVARSHATLSFSDGKWRIVDSDTESGTYVNGMRTEQALLSYGDTVYIMGLILTVQNGYFEITAPAERLRLNDKKFTAENEEGTRFRLAGRDAVREESGKLTATGEIGEDLLGWSELESESFSGIQISSVSPLSVSEPPSGEEYPEYEGATTILGLETVKAPPKKAPPALPRLLRDKTGEEIFITSTPFTIGKTGCSYCIGDNKAISRSHAKITRDGDGFFLTDNNSTNKTYINGAMLTPNTPAKLASGCKLRLANEGFTFLV